MKSLSLGRHLLCILAALWLGLSSLGAKDFVVVLDAGHGGRDAGALGVSAKEKDINLGVALKLGRMIENNTSGVKVVYTRKKDVFLTLQERADLANKSGGDLFISIHTNSVDKKSPGRKTVSGASTWTLGLHRTKENLEVAKRENSVICLESDFSTRYEGFDPNSTESYIIFEFMQYKHMEQSINFASGIQREFVSTAGRIDRGVHQAGFWVLASTSMPAVLVELDFICNPNQEKFLTSDSGQEKMAKAIYNAFTRYKSDYDRKQNAGKSVAAPNEPLPEKKSEQKAPAATPKPAETQQPKGSTDTETTCYRIQFMAIPQLLPAGSKEFKGLSPVEYYVEGGMYKYTYGESTERSEIQKVYNKVKALFPDAFIIRFKDGKRAK